MSTGVTGAQREDAAGRNAFSAVLIALMKGVLHAEVAPKDWQALLDLQAEAGAESVTLWLLPDDESTRAFLAASGFAPDGAFRDRVVSPDGATLREVRLTADIGEDPAQ